MRHSVRALVAGSPTFTTAEAKRAGVSPRDLYAAREEGDIVELSRGVFRSASAPALAHSALLAVSRRVPRGTVCLQSALDYWDLTDELPSEVHVAVARGTPQPTISHPPTKVHVFEAKTFGVGRLTEALTKRESIAIYSAERAVVDGTRARHIIGSEVAFHALDRYLSRRGAQPRVLMELARRLRVERVMADAIEVLSASLAHKARNT